MKPYWPFNSEAQLKAHVERTRATREKAAAKRARPPLEPGSSRVWAQFPDYQNGPSSWWGGTVVRDGGNGLSVVFDDGTLEDIEDRYVKHDPPACLPELEVTEPTEAALRVLSELGVTVAPVAQVAGGRSRRRAKDRHRRA